MTNPPEPAASAGAPVCYRHPGREALVRCQRCERPICPDCMRDAAVGFHCPECVQEAARTMRRVQGPYGGTPSAAPAQTTFALIGVNVAVWVAVLLTGWKDSALIERLALIPRGLCASRSDPSSYWSGALDRGVCEVATGGDGTWVAGVADGAVWQLLTSAFAHVEIWHIAANMLSLFVLGPQLEQVLGRVRFLAVYAASILVGSTTVYWLAEEQSRTLGASVAVFGLFGALAVIVLKVGGDLRSIAGLLVLNVFITFAIPDISWQGHLGGLAGGTALAAVLVYAPRQNRARWQLLGGALIVVLAVAALVARTVVLA